MFREDVMEIKISLHLLLVDFDQEAINGGFSCSVRLRSLMRTM